MQVRRCLFVLSQSTRARVRVLQTVVVNAPLVFLAMGLLPVLRWVCHALASLFDAAALDSVDGRAAVARADGVAAAIVNGLGLLPYMIGATVISTVWLGHVTADAIAVATQAQARTEAALAQKRTPQGAAAVPAPPTNPAPAPSPPPLLALTEAIFRAVAVLLMNAAATALDVLLPPALGKPAALLLTALLASAVAHDPLWAARGLPVTARFDALEARWPYFAGFGAAAAGLTFFGGALVNAAAYNVVLPWLVMAAVLHSPEAVLAAADSGGCCATCGCGCGRRTAVSPASVSVSPAATLPLLRLADVDLGVPWTRPFRAAALAALERMATAASGSPAAAAAGTTPRHARH